MEEYLKKATPIYSLVYLYALHFASENKPIPTITKQAENIGLLPSDVNSAWLYWITQGLARVNGEEIELTAMLENIGDSCTLPEPESDANIDCIEANSEELVTWVLNEANEAFDGSMSARDLETLTWLLNEKILPPEVMLQLINFAKNSGKLTMRYIEKVALDWQEKKINTVLKAEEFIKSMEKPRKRVRSTKAKKSAFHNFEGRPFDSNDDVYNRLFDAMGS